MQRKQTDRHTIPAECWRHSQPRASIDETFLDDLTLSSLVIKEMSVSSANNPVLASHRFPWRAPQHKATRGSTMEKHQNRAPQHKEEHHWWTPSKSTIEEQHSTRQHQGGASKQSTNVQRHYLRNCSGVAQWFSIAKISVQSHPALPDPLVK